MSIDLGAFAQPATQSLVSNMGQFVQPSFLDNLGGYFSKGLSGMGTGMNFLNDNSEGIGAIGGIYGAYNQQKMAKKQFGLQQQAFDFNKMLSQREIDRQDKADKSLQTAFNNSTYGA